jgi:hypothetical protein
MILNDPLVRLREVIVSGVKLTDLNVINPNVDASNRLIM